MINEINASQRYSATNATKSANQPAAEKTAKVSKTEDNSKVDTIAFGTRQETPVTYEKITAKRLDSTGLAAIKAEADRATENLRKLVEELILKQKVTTDDVEKAKLAISEDGEFGVKAVSDRLVDFAISVSGGDKSKLSELISAIDEGFAAAKKALGGELPEISKQTYDETMRKLNDWANETDS